MALLIRRDTRGAIFIGANRCGPGASPNQLNGESKKRVVIITSLLLVIVGAGVWIYFTEFAGPSLNEALHTGVGVVMADETAALLGKRGQIVIVAMDTSKAPELKPQIEAFLRQLKKNSAITVKEQVTLDTEGKSNYGAGMGLSSRRFLRLVKKQATVDAIVSFVGAPRMSDEEIAQLGTIPKFIPECRSPDKIKRLFEKDVMHVAIVSRFEFPAPGKHSPRKPSQWFEKRYQVVTKKNSSDLPGHTAD